MNPTSRRQFDTMVLAADLTRSASTTPRYGQAIVRQHKSVLAVVYVIEAVGYAFPDREPGFAAANQAARDELQGIEKETRRQSVRTHSIVDHGVVYERILKIALALHADLPVLSTRVQTEIGRATLGTLIALLVPSCVNGGWHCVEAALSRALQRIAHSAGRTHHHSGT
jgi:nucleotide-binding universal stress UspA family protein